MEQRGVRYIKVRTRREEEEEEEEDEIEEEVEQFYNSHKFAIGYNALQARWRSHLPHTSSKLPHLTSLSPQSHLSTLSQHSHSPLPTPDQESRRKSLHLPLDSPHYLPASSSPSLSTTTYASYPDSPSSSPTSLLSIPTSTSSFSSFSSTFSSSLTNPTSASSSSSSPSTPSPDTPFREHVPLISEEVRERQGERERSSRLVSVLRQVLHETLTHAHLRRRRKHQSQHAAPNEQVAVLENELEAYRVLSRAKKEAADLLKHELMAVLYERVMAQEEQDQLRRQLEGEIVSLEYQLHEQKVAAHHHLAALSSQLDRALEEKQVLQQQINPRLYPPCRPPPDADLRKDVLAAEGCRIRRRRSY